MTDPSLRPIPNTRGKEGAPPHLLRFLNTGNLQELPGFSKVPRGDDRTVYAAIRAAGYDGIQGGDPVLARDVGLLWATGARANAPGEIPEQARKAAGEGALCMTLHLAWGLESDAEMDAFAHSVLESAERFGIPLYVETHRATLTQDMYRTVQWVKRFPGLRFNGDFSHWYTGQEMVYGGVERKLDFIAPVLERVRFIHGRIGNPGSMQVPVIGHEHGNHVTHFREMWTRSFRGFLASATAGEAMIFCPELLYTKNFYARTFPGPQGTPVEESDRWEEALAYLGIAQACFDAARGAG